MNKCFCCDNEAIYKVGFSKYNWKRKAIVKGYSCLACIPESLNRLGNGSFGSEYWPVVLFDNKVIYNSYLANLEGLSHLSGWNKYLSTL